MTKPIKPYGSPLPAAPAPASGAEPTSGEGADTALQAMLRKRKQQLDTPDPAAPPHGGHAEDLNDLGTSSA